MVQINEELDAVVARPGQCLQCGGKTQPPRTLCAGCRDTPVPAAPSEGARRELAARELARRRFLAFVLRMRPDYQAGWFHRDLAARLERFVHRVERGESPRLIINVPPRHGKSEQASKLLPPWALGRNPGWKIISATHSDKLAMDNSYDVLNYIKDERYRTVFPDTVLDKDRKGAAGWRTSEGGIYKPVGVGAGIAGYGANILIIDDPHRDRDAYSSVVRDSIWRWYTSSAKTRLLPGGGIIVIQTRWVTDDLTGRLIEEEGRIEDGGAWEVVCYPAEAVQDEYRLPNGQIIHTPHPDAVLLRRKGTLLHPERYNEAMLAQFRKDPVTWQGLYQQNPTSGDAAQFTEELLELCACKMADIPKRLAKYSTWDLAVGQKERNDYSVEATGGIDADDTLWLVDVQRGRWDPHDLVERMIDSYGTNQQEMIGIERGVLSMAIGPFLDKRIQERRAYGMVVVDLGHGNKDKVARARPIQARMRQGKVKIPTDAPWYEAFKKELLEFPGGKHDDQVDAFAYLGQLLETMQQPKPPRTEREKSWRDRVEKYVRRGGRHRSWRSA